MKKITSLVLCFMLALSLAACGNQESADSQRRPSSSAQSESIVSSNPQSNEENQQDDTDSSTTAEGSKTLVAYFAYAENIGDTSGMDVDAIASASIDSTSNREGNLQLMAQIIQETKGADVFHIVVQEPYDPEYDIMHDRAVDEIDGNAFPALTEKVENLDQYDVIYLGMPVWSGALPRPVATFLAENDLSGKTVVPFGIHLGSRFGRMIGEIEELCPNATLVDGYTVNAGTSNNDVRDEFSQWLNGLELNEKES